MGRTGSHARQGLWVLLNWRRRDLPREQKSESIEKTEKKQRTIRPSRGLFGTAWFSFAFPLANKRRRSLRSVKVLSVEQPGRLVQQGSPKRERPTCYGRSVPHRAVDWNRKSRSAGKVRLVEIRWCSTRYESAQKRTPRMNLVPQGLRDLSQLRTANQNVICEEKWSAQRKG